MSKLIFALPLLASVAAARSLKTSMLLLLPQLCLVLAVEVALYLAFHSLIYRWFISPTSSLPYPPVCRAHAFTYDPTHTRARPSLSSLVIWLHS
jgi:hypothetical protein